MKPALPTGLLFFALLAAGCQALPEPVCQSTLLVPIRQATGPRSSLAKQTVTYQVGYKLGSNCGAFGSYALSGDTTTTGVIIRQVGVNAVLTGCSCTPDTVTITPGTYQFQPQRAGTYYVQFLAANGKFITDTLTVR